MRLEGKIAVVTGAGSGIGRSISERFAEEGATVALLDIDGAAAESVAKTLAGSGHRAFQVDVADSASMAAAFSDVDEAYGRIDVLVNNAGVDRTEGDGFDKLMQGEVQILHMTDEAWRRLMGINVDGVFYGTREAVRRMIREEKGGAIVNMSSIAGLVGQGPMHYAGSKAAVLGMTKSNARELGRFKIRVNAICPGVIDTPMTEAVPEFALKGLIATTPLGCVGEPVDIANAALYFACDESKFVTGQWISPNGGLILS